MEIFKRQNIGEISMTDGTESGVAASILSDITVFMKYAKYNETLGRRETWDEIVTRNKEMHQRKYPELKLEIERVYKLVYEVLISKTTN